MTFTDTYFYLLENPDKRDYACFSDDIPHETQYFDILKYSASRGQTFNTPAEAYNDWINNGRRLGLIYAKERHTVLKIILKVKDEVSLIDKWISHHASIVGFDNLIIMDCCSTEKKFISKLGEYKDKILILQYRKPHNHLHSIPRNYDFYSVLSKNCKYLTVLDADEFLFSYEDGGFNCNSIIEKLTASNEKIFPCTWINSVSLVGNEDGSIDWDVPISLSTEESNLRKGTIFGKSIINTSSLMEVNHIGHNLRTQEVINLIDSESFGQFFIIHLKDFHPKILVPRLLNHIRASRDIPETIQEYGEILEYLKNKKKFNRPASANYAKRLIYTLEHQNTMPEIPTYSETTRLFSKAKFEQLPLLAASINKFNFINLLVEFKRPT